MAEIALCGNIAFFGHGPGGGPMGGRGPGGPMGPMGGGPMGPMGPMRGGFMGFFFSPHPHGGDGGKQKNPKDKKSLIERLGEFLADIIY